MAEPKRKVSAAPGAVAPIEALGVEILIRAKDVDKLVGFYRDVFGLAFEREDMEDDWGYVALVAGIRFTILRAPKAVRVEEGNCRIRLVVRDVPECLARLDGLDHFEIAPAMTPRQEKWGRRAAFFDPEWNVVEIGDTVKERK